MAAGRTRHNSLTFPLHPPHVRPRQTHLAPLFFSLPNPSPLPTFPIPSLPLPTKSPQNPLPSPLRFLTPHPSHSHTFFFFFELWWSVGLAITQLTPSPSLPNPLTLPRSPHFSPLTSPYVSPLTLLPTFLPPLFRHIHLYPSL
jgi:hypothetical protein